jgi:FeS assembly SUF system regulator
MFRLSKITDYGIVLLARLARDTEATTHNARELAAEVELPAPVVSKILKLLAREGVLESRRGAKGGYELIRRPEDLTVAEMIGILEGPVALTQCSAAEPSSCEHETNCAVREPWRIISGVVEEALSTITLEDLNDRSFREVLLPLQIEGTRVEPGNKIAGGA